MAMPTYQSMHRFENLNTRVRVQEIITKLNMQD
jgi:hypothetical protein